MNAKTLEAITKHGNALLAAFPNATEKRPVALCKKLRRIETSLAGPLVDYCNGDLQDDEDGTKLDAICDKARERVEKLLGQLPVISRNSGSSECPSCGARPFEVHAPNCKGGNHRIESAFHVNRDPRGYALKLDDTWTREYNRMADLLLYTDMGGYGILAPDLNN